MKVTSKVEMILTAPNGAHERVRLTLEPSGTPGHIMVTVGGDGRPVTYYSHMNTDEADEVIAALRSMVAEARRRDRG